MTDGKTLIVGANGMIGKGLSNALESRGRKVVRATRASNDFRLDRNYFEGNALEGIGKVIFCASPNYKLPEETLKTFLRDASSFLSACNEQRIPLVFLSTNLVFDCTNRGAPSDQPNPICLYGRHKAELERIVSYRPENAVVRFTKVIGPRTMPFFDLYEKLSQKRVIAAFDNLFISPVPLTFAVRALSQIVLEEHRGVFHLSSQDQLSFAETMEMIAAKLNIDPSLVQRMPVDPAVVPRVNRQSGLDCQSTSEILGVTMPFAAQAIHEFCGGLAAPEDVRTVTYV